MTETWYVMEDGSLGDPRHIAEDALGVLRHRDGRAVAYGQYGPRSRGGVDAAAERAKTEAVRREAKKVFVAPADEDPSARDMTAEPPQRRYKTRESKAR